MTGTPPDFNTKPSLKDIAVKLNATSILALQFAVAGLLAAGVVGAQQMQLPPEARAKAREVGLACWTDLKTYCGNVQRGEGRIAQCLQANRAKLSEPCRSKLAEVMAQ